MLHTVQFISVYYNSVILRVQLIFQFLYFYVYIHTSHIHTYILFEYK